MNQETNSPQNNFELPKPQFEDVPRPSAANSQPEVTGAGAAYPEALHSRLDVPGAQTGLPPVADNQQPTTAASDPAGQSADGFAADPAVASAGGASAGHSIAPPMAEDADLIEKEWVIKAKEIVESTRDDPYKQNKEISRFKADYMKKRYNKDIKVED